jgi:membrane-bound inhibitor of C-type lysozyme
VKYFLLCSALSLSFLMMSQPTFAQATSKPAVSADDEDSTPDTGGSITHEYHCEMKDTLTIYTNNDDNNHIALRWKNRIYRMHRVVTTTGATRFENTNAGIVWIGIPAKGMLLDSRHGQQLTNDCKTAGQ